MSEIIRFEFDEPQEITLKFDSGRESHNYGPQMMYSTTDGCIFYLPMDCEAIEQMERLGIVRNVPFRITKIKMRGKTGWKVERLDQIEPRKTESVRPGANQGAPPSRTAADPSKTSNNQQPQKFSGLSVYAQEMAGCLIAAMDAADVAKRYGSSKGMIDPDFSFSGEDLRAIAATLYIQHCKALPVQSQDHQGSAGSWPRQ